MLLFLLPRGRESAPGKEGLFPAGTIGRAASRTGGCDGHRRLGHVVEGPGQLQNVALTGGHSVAPGQGDPPTTGTTPGVHDAVSTVKGQCGSHLIAGLVAPANDRAYCGGPVEAQNRGAARGAGLCGLSSLGQQTYQQQERGHTAHSVFHRIHLLLHCVTALNCAVLICKCRRLWIPHIIFEKFILFF